jgi:hypothetical protein
VHPWQYHPQEIIWRSRRDSGLSRALASRLQSERPTAWIGHGAQLPAEASGPSARARLDGTLLAAVFNGRQSVWTRDGHPDLALQKQMLQGVDLAVIEGLVDSDAPWVVELDDEGRGLEEIALESRGAVAAMVGTRGPLAELPPGGIPRFSPEDMGDLGDHLLDLLEQAARARPLEGLLLTSPEDPREAREAAVRALTGACDRVWCLEPDDALRRAGVEPLEARHPQWGQAGQILSLQETRPDAAVVSLEASLEQVARLERLLDYRDVLAEATAFRARDTHMASPGCAVWEPRSRSRLLGMLSLDVACLRRTLVAANTTLLEA